MSFGVAMHLYDKSDELQTNINIIRNVWKRNSSAHISVHCNDVETYDVLKKMDIDTLVLECPKLSDNPKTNQRMRCHDTVVRSVLANPAEYVVQWHSDAYALDENVIFDMINFMEKEGKRAAVRGRGFDFRSGKCPYGDIDDHFMILNKRAFEKRDPMNLPLSNFLSTFCNESLWSYFFQLKYDPIEVYHYSDMSSNRTKHTDDNNLGSDGNNYYADTIDHRALHPYNIDEERKFFHIGDKACTREILEAFGIDPAHIYVTDRVNKPKYTM